MNRFTGQKDVDITILNLLEDKDLINMCKTNKYVYSICENDTFWRDRIINKYNVLPDIAPFENYREFYTSNKMKALQLCLEISKLPNRSQLVVDDFYNPYTGFVNANFIAYPQITNYLLLKIVLTRISSFVPRDMKKEDEIKRLIIKQNNKIGDHARNLLKLDPNSNVLIKKERKLFLRYINKQVTRASLLRETAKTKPSYVKALSPRPEDKFALITYIHEGFVNQEIPLDILWEELCTLPYILEYSP